MKIDLHNHTTYSSACSVLDVTTLILTARQRGIDAIAVTEHNTMEGAWNAVEMGRKLGFPVFPGQEVRTLQGDILCFGIHDEGLADIETRDLIDLARARGGVLIPAHPFRIAALALRNQLFDYPGGFIALEGLNGNCSLQENQQASVAAQKLGLPLIGGSDAHSEAMVGRFYTEFRYTVQTESDLILALRQGDYTAAENSSYSTLQT